MYALKKMGKKMMKMMNSYVKQITYVYRNENLQQYTLTTSPILPHY